MSVPVAIGSELVGEVVGVADRLTAEGVLVRCAPTVLAPGTVVTVHFRHRNVEMTARAEVLRNLVGALDLRFLDWT